jgi:periplasmic divalent cation tolerance protein
MMTDYIIVFVTAASEEEAALIGQTIVGERLAACVNIIRSIRSIYRWQGRIEDEQEVLLIIKTKRTLFENLKKRVKELHSYSVPEIVALPLVGGDEQYLNWLGERQVMTISLKTHEAFENSLVYRFYPLTVSLNQVKNNSS